MLRSPAKILLALALPFAVAAIPAIAPREALADAPADAPAPAPRTAFSAPFQRYLVAPNGRTLGLLLADGTFVHTPGRALRHDAPYLQTGTKLDVEGVVKQTPTGKIVMGSVVRLNGDVIADVTKARGRHAHKKGHEGKERHGKHHVELKPLTGAGQIAVMISSPRGQIHALVLTDGTTAVGHDLGGLGLKIGDQISVAGMGGVYPKGKSVRIEKVTMPNGQVRDLPRPARPQPEPEPGQGPV